MTDTTTARSEPEERWSPRRSLLTTAGAAFALWGAILFCLWLVWG